MSEVGCDIVEYLKEFHTSEGKAVKAREMNLETAKKHCKRSEAEWRGYM